MGDGCGECVWRIKSTGCGSVRAVGKGEAQVECLPGIWCWLGFGNLCSASMEDLDLGCMEVVLAVFIRIDGATWGEGAEAGIKRTEKRSL